MSKEASKEVTGTFKLKMDVQGSWFIFRDDKGNSVSGCEWFTLWLKGGAPHCSYNSLQDALRALLELPD